MQLTKIVLKNYGVYRDKVEFDLTTTDEKPVILIGGTNGAGKTTLFESILLGFYGQSYFDKKTTRKTYEKFLSNKIHRFLGTATSADSTSIIIDFNFYHNGAISKYSVDRTWHNDDGRIIETLKIRKDGTRLDSVEESQWQSFIEELIPKGVAKLFFFDGEKIVKMAEDESQEIEIKSSFDSLLGLDIVEQLRSDLQVHVMRNMNDDSKSIQIQHDQLMKERDEITSDKANLEMKLGALMDELDEITQKIDSQEANVRKIGGGFASKRDELISKKSLYEFKKESIENDLRDIVSGPLPFYMMPDELKSLKNQINNDQSILKKQFETQIIDEKSSMLIEKLQTDSTFLKLDVTNQKELIQKITTVFASEKKLKNETCMFDFSPLDYSKILQLLEQLDSIHYSKLDELNTDYLEVLELLTQIDTALTNVPKDDEIGPLISELNNLHEQQGGIKKECEHLDQKIMGKNSYERLLNVKIRNILSDRYKNKNAEIQVELAIKVQKVLDEYVDKLKIKKIQLLEKYLLEEIQRLMHKENLITKVKVQKETFDIILYDRNGNSIPNDLLSKGEKQMFATAVLLALAKTSGKPLPFMIDTPLARLDVGHRDNLIEKFFPYASHQVVIFSTDSEIDQNYYSKMKPYITRSYAMEYLPGKGKTQQHSTYFWDENGVKTIAV